MKLSYKVDKLQIPEDYTDNAGVQFTVLAGNAVCTLFRCQGRRVQSTGHTLPAGCTHLLRHQKSVHAVFPTKTVN